MSSVDAASDPAQTVAPPASSLSPPEQPPSQPDPSGHQEPPRDADSAPSSSEIEARVQSTEAGQSHDATAPPVEGTPSTVDPEILGTVGEPVDGVDADHAAGAVDESGQWAEDESHELKRVKVYELIQARWVDKGTAFCFGDFQDNEALLIARAEDDFQHVILTTTIRATDVYQRQAETLIVWTEPDGVDYALSFQEPEGCAEVWHFIEEVQRHMNAGEDMALTSSPLIGPEGPEHSVTTANILRSGRLPQPQMGIIGEIDTAIKTLARTAVLKERVCEYIQNEEYIKALIDVFHQAEDLESLADLHALFGCMQTILLLNEHSLYEHILDDDIFLGVVGILEYDPEFPNYKANYRDFLRDTSRFHQPIPIRDDSIQRKIHHTYRLLFLKDVVLARAIDDSTFNVLNSSIIFNQIDIITHVQNDQAFLREIAGMFMDDDLLALLGLPTKNGEASKEPALDKMDVDSPDAKAANGAVQPNGHTQGSSTSNKALSPEELSRRREVVFLVQQLCMMGKNVQLPARMSLFRALVDRGIVFAVQWGLSQSEADEDGRQMIATSGEIMMGLLDHDLNGVRGHVLKQLGTMEREKQNGKNVKDKETVLMLMCRVLVRSRDLAVQSLVGEALRLLLELVGSDGIDGPNIGLKMLQQRAKDDPGIEKFLDYFYKFCIDTLFKPFQEVPEFKDVSDPTFTLSREKTNLFLWLCDLLSNFTQQHSFRSHFFVLSSNIAPRVATLLRSKDKHLRLAAFRFFRTCLRLKNGNIFKHLIKHNIFQPILQLTTRESKRDNLVSSTCLEYFDYMRRENIKELINHCMTKHGDTVRALAESPVVGPRFKDFISRWEMNIEPPPVERIEKLPGTPSRGWGQGKLLDTAEEDYFNGDDEDEEHIPIVSTPPPPRGVAVATGKRKRPMRPTGIPVRAPPKPAPFNGLPRPLPLGSLVDYGDADGDGDDMAAASENVAPVPSPTPGRASPIPGGFISVAFPPSPGGGTGTGLGVGVGVGVGTEPPASPRIAHRQVASIKSAINPEDDSDILEELSRGGPTLLPRISGMSDVGGLSGLGLGIGGGVGGGVGSKRRRGEADDDDDDQLLERLSKSKRQTPNPLSPHSPHSDADSPGPGLGPGLTGPKPMSMSIPPKGSIVGGEEGPKKLKLKFGAVGAAFASSQIAKSESASSPGTKDGDNG